MIDLDALAQMARNRGLKLVRSRVRTPGKRGFGKVGLSDAAGKPVFGVDSKRPAATPEEVEDYLRGLGASDWGASLDAGSRVRKRAKKPPPNSANDSRPAPKMPAAKPLPKIRDAKPADAPRLVELIGELGHPIDEKALRRNLGELKKGGELPLVATLGKEVVGLVGRHLMVTVHRRAPVGRIPILVVGAKARGQDIGRMLVAAVESWCRDRGCKIVEVTSNDRLNDAHSFYRHMGYERTSLRFMKTL